jgi:hypothetical protein
MRATYRSAAVELLRELDGTHRDLAEDVAVVEAQRAGMGRGILASARGCGRGSTTGDHVEARRAGGDGTPPARTRPIRVATRTTSEHHRASAWMRLDPLQLVAWAAGLQLVVSGLVVLARSGLDEPSMFRPVVEVAGLSATPLLGGVLVAIGAGSLTAATGEVDERVLRLGGVLLAIVGAVWMIEPDAFTLYLGITQANGLAAIAIGAAYTMISFVPPLAVRRPGVAEFPGS